MTRRGLSRARFLARKPCPFCGKDKTCLSHTRDGERRPRWLVFCNHKDCRVRPETDFFVRGADAVRAWNKRGEEKHESG